MRKGSRVQYIGTKNELMIGKVYRVLHKSGNWLEIMAPVRYLDGSVHLSKACYPIDDFRAV